MIFFDRKGRLVKIDAAGDRSLAAMGIKLDSREDKRVDAFNADSRLRAGRAPLPDWLARHDWAQRLHGKDAGVPYGIALAAAALAVYPQTPWMAIAT